ncbi:hypothetical protein [Paenisporosarcina sp. NPDC076898]|uniref:hypothetical protein n=1 Tax=unclassified Paenisporosarcina TaxID=2642018 RepID=UPI003D00820D
MFSNDTVRLKVKFRDFDGQAIEPSDVTLTTYKLNKEVIETITQESLIKEDIGCFFYDYTVGAEDFIFEFSGLHNNKSVLSRDQVQIKFI